MQPALLRWVRVIVGQAIAYALMWATMNVASIDLPGWLDAVLLYANWTLGGLINALGKWLRDRGWTDWTP